MTKLLLSLAFVAVLSGCAGSPMHTSSLPQNQLQQLDNYTLCKAYTPRELYTPSASIINEVARRGINCGAIYQYGGGTQGLEQGLRMMQGQPATSQTSGGAAKGTAFLKSESKSGLNKICYYDRTGSVYAITIASTEICPLSQ